MEDFFMFNVLLETTAEEQFQATVNSTAGQVIIVVLGIALLLLAVRMAGSSKRGISIKALTYSALAIAVSTILSQIPLFKLPQGGSITPFSMLFIIAIGYFFGVKTGVLAGVVYGLMQLMLNGYVIYPVQLLFDYPLAFGALGLSGLFADKKNGLVKGIIVGTFGRFFFHFLSGVFFFGSFAPEGWNFVVYSAWYNFSYVALEGVLTVILVSIGTVGKAFEQVKKSLIA